MSALVFSRDRMGEEVDQVVIKEIISSFVVLLKFKARNQMQVCQSSLSEVVHPVWIL